MPIKLIGIGDNGVHGLHPQLIEWIENAEVLVGGERLLSFFPNFKGEKIVLKTKIMRIVEQLGKRNQNIVILASGDPLFYGIGGLLSKKSRLKSIPISVQYNLQRQNLESVGKMPILSAYMDAQ